MGGHGHHHGAGAATGHRARLLVVLAVTTAAMVAELIGAWVSGSLALAADAGHMFTDAAAIAIALVAMTIAQRSRHARSTFGLFRLEIFAAVVNAVILLVLAGWIIWTSVERLADPPDVESGVMGVVAVLGLAANGFGLWWLHGAQQHSLNVRGAYLEVLGDLLGSVAVIVAAGVIAVTGELVADPLASLLVAALIVPRTFLLLGESVGILLEATPRGVDLTHVRAHIVGVEGVHSVHDLHVWTISSQLPVMSAHVVLEGAWLHRSGEVLDALQVCLAAHFDVEHCTFQLEPPGHAAHEATFHP